MFRADPGDEKVSCSKKIKTFLAVHWKGILIVFLPLILSAILFPFPPPKWKWAAYTLIIMALFWVTECLPLAVTSFIPVVIFPLTGVMHAKTVCACYMNDSIMMFLGSLLLAYSVEQSGFHKRLAYCTIRTIGYSHLKLLGAMSVVTTFVSMWITNTAATTMVVPINFALLRVFENEGILKIYQKGADGSMEATPLTVCYFCSATYSATIGGIGTLVGTATNLVFKGLFMEKYKDAPEYLSFPKFSMFAVPYMIVIETCHYLFQCIYYLGLGRPKSVAAKRALITKEAMAAAKRTIEEETRKLGSITFWEIMVVILFGSAILLFFSRSPQLFYGWGDLIQDHFEIKEKAAFVRDSSLALLVIFLMVLCPATLDIFKNFTAKTVSQLPKSRVQSVLRYAECAANMPFSFCFLLGGGTALSKAANVSGLNEKLGENLQILQKVPNAAIMFLLILLTIFITNFASNVAVANVICPVAMQLAQEINQNPLWYCLATGVSASFCFMIPVGTPGNLIVKSSASVSTSQMMVAGSGPTVTTLIWTWVFMMFFAPIVWPDISSLQPWAAKKSAL